MHINYRKSIKLTPSIFTSSESMELSLRESNAQREGRNNIKGFAYLELGVFLDQSLTAQN